MTEAFEIRSCRDETEFMQIVDQILLPSFPPSELASTQQFREGFNRGLFLTEAAFDRTTAAPLAVAIGTAPPSTDDVILLNWLAVSQNGRGRGVGGQLLDHTISQWVNEFSPTLIVGEVEDPHYHQGSESTGDPTARLRFYLRHGARRIDTPYVMPLVAADAPRVDHMLLLAFGGTATNPGASQSQLGDAVERFVRRYVEASPEPRDAAGNYLPEVENMLALASQARLVD